MVIWLQLCTSYSSSCHRHPQPQLNPEWRHSGTGLPGLSCKMAVKQESSSVSCTTSLTDWFKLRQQQTARVQAHVSPTQLVMLQGPSRCFQPRVILWRGLSRSHRFVTFTVLQLSGFTVPTLHIVCTYLPTLKTHFTTHLPPVWCLGQSCLLLPVSPSPTAVALPPSTAVCVAMTDGIGGEPVRASRCPFPHHLSALCLPSDLNMGLHHCNWAAVWIDGLTWMITQLACNTFVLLLTGNNTPEIQTSVTTCWSRWSIL